MKTPLYIVGVATAFAVMRRTSIQAYGGDPDLPRPKYQFIFPYVPHQTGPISFDRPITCVFQTYSVAGYRKKEFLKPDSDILERADITPDESPNVWKITLHDKIANLIITGGGWEDIKNETWVVVLKTEKYLILVQCETSDPETIRTITINAQYGTFVQCFNGEAQGVNHGAISWGYWH